MRGQSLRERKKEQDNTLCLILTVLCLETSCWFRGWEYVLEMKSGKASAEPLGGVLSRAGRSWSTCVITWRSSNDARKSSNPYFTKIRKWQRLGNVKAELTAQFGSPGQNENVMSQQLNTKNFNCGSKAINQALAPAVRCGAFPPICGLHASSGIFWVKLWLKDASLQSPV